MNDYHLAEYLQGFDDEVRIMKRFANLFPGTYTHMPGRFDPFDFKYIGDDFGRLCVEVKRRWAKADAYPTVLIDTAKLDVAIPYASQKDARFAFVVEWVDALGFAIIDTSAHIYARGTSARHDRPDDGERNVTHIPRSHFRIIA
jgi:hypothetical protein